MHDIATGYDYSGYGCSTGSPTVSNTIADINACYQFLLQSKGKRPQDIVVYGQSVGSGPSCDLGAAEQDLKGIILHSPLMSGTLKNLETHVSFVQWRQSCSHCTMLLPSPAQLNVNLNAQPARLSAWVSTPQVKLQHVIHTMSLASDAVQSERVVS